MSTNSQSSGPSIPLTVAARDVVTVGCLAIVLLCVHDLGSPFIRGFQCDDETIRYPYKDSTIESSVCYLVGSGTNVVLILVLEYLKLVKKSRSDSAQTAGDKFQLKLYLRNVYCRILIWLFGAISSELLTDISKLTAGRLRPHFIAICKPMRIVYDGRTYETLEDYCSHSENRYLYVTNYTCTGPPAKQRDARLSFMSGHSSYSAYSAAFAVFYIQSAMDLEMFGLLKPALQVLITSAAFYTGLTRVSDYKHHWQDVLAGLLQGTTVAAVVSKFVWPAFQRSYQSRVKSNSRGGDEPSSGDELNRVSY